MRVWIGVERLILAAKRRHSVRLISGFSAVKFPSFSTIALIAFQIAFPRNTHFKQKANTQIQSETAWGESFVAREIMGRSAWLSRHGRPVLAAASKYWKALRAVHL